MALVSVCGKKAPGFTALGCVGAPANVFAFMKEKGEAKAGTGIHSLPSAMWPCREFVTCSEMVIYTVKPEGWELLPCHLFLWRLVDREHA